MKRALLTAVALAACTWASAQGNVTIYGEIDEYVDHSSSGAGHATRPQSGGLAGSRLGFRGREGLGTPYGEVSLGRQYVPHFYLFPALAADGGLAFGNAIDYYAGRSDDADTVRSDLREASASFPIGATGVVGIKHLF